MSSISRSLISGVVGRDLSPVSMALAALGLAPTLVLPPLKVGYARGVVQAAILEVSRVGRRSAGCITGKIGDGGKDEKTLEGIVIQLLEQGEIRDASLVVSRAFATSPSWAWVFQGQVHRMEPLFRMTFEHSSGQTLVAKESAQIVGVLHAARWPRCYRLSMSPMQWARALPLMFGALWGAPLRAIRFFSIGQRNDPKQPHWHLGPVGVLPERQGQGIGSNLMKRFCENLDELGEPCHLETDKPENLRFYERFGFSVTGETLLDKLSIWLMWRPPRGRNHS